MNLEIIGLFGIAFIIIAVVVLVWVVAKLLKVVGEATGDKRAIEISEAINNGYQKGLEVIRIDQVDSFVETAISKLEAYSKKTEESSIDDIIAALARQGYTLIKQDRIVSTNADVVTSVPAATVTVSTAGADDMSEALKKLYGDLPKTNMRYVGDDLDFGRKTEE